MNSTTTERLTTADPAEFVIKLLATVIVPDPNNNTNLALNDEGNKLFNSFLQLYGQRNADGLMNIVWSMFKAIRREAAELTNY